MTASRERALALGVVLLLAAAVWAVYGPAADAPFIFDDLPGIVKNPSIVRLWPPIGDAEVRGPLNPPPLASTARRPLPNLTLALNYRVGGLDPRGYHVVNFALHALVAVVLAAVVRRTLRLPYFGDAWGAAPPQVVRTLLRPAWPLSVIVALVWALHPLVTEAVVYVTQRTELLGALFYLTTLWAALRYWAADARAARSLWLACAALACLAGMASKEIVASAPLVVLLLEATFLVGSVRTALRRSWPLYVALASTWAPLVLLSAFGVGGLSDARHRVPLLVWWATQTKVLLLYLKLALWPWPLSLHYAPAFLRTVSAAAPWVAAVAAALAVATAMAVRRRPAARFVVAAVVLVLAPTVVVPLPKMMAAERRMYLPLAGLVTLAVVGGYRALSRRWPAGAPRVAGATAAVLIVGLSVVTSRRLQAYATAVTIWHDAVTHQPADPMSRYNLGVALLDEGRRADAMAQFEATLRLDPEHTGALDNLGMVLNDLGRRDEAIEHFARALAIDPADAVAHNNLGAALVTMGRPHDALRHLERALALQPDEAKVHLNLGRALQEVGRTDDAVTHLARAVERASDDADAQYSLGVVLTRLGRPTEALPHLQAAADARPDDAELHDALATALLRAGRADEAVARYRRALALKDDYPEAHNNLGSALVALGRTDDAVAEFERAIRLNPDHANAHFNLANTLLSAGRPREAVAHFEHAVRLRPDDAQARFESARAYAASNERARAVATAEEALTVARAESQGALVDRIGAWLAAYRATDGGSPDAPHHR